MNGMIDPKTENDLLALIAAKVQENLHLDYKSSAALVSAKGLNEVSKDASAFANSDGGTIVFGVCENHEHGPESIDAGVPASSISKEQIEARIHANTSPRIDGLTINAIRLSTGNYAYSILIPKSFKIHQDRVSHRFYKRFDFSSHPMEAYEIEDVRSRQRSFKSLVRASVVLSQRFIFTLTVRNPGDFVARDVHLSFQPALPWKNGTPAAIKDGIRYLNPGQEISFYLDSTPEVLKIGSQYPRVFEAEVEYFHTLLDKTVSEIFPVDLGSLDGAALPQTEFERMADKLNGALGDLKNQISKVAQHLETIARLSDPTGLALSQSTLRNLRNIASGEELDSYQLDFRRAFPHVLQEVLQTDFERASKLYQYIEHPSEGDSLEKLFADAPEFLKKVRERLAIE